VLVLSLGLAACTNDYAALQGSGSTAATSGGSGASGSGGGGGVGAGGTGAAASSVASGPGGASSTGGTGGSAPVLSVPCAEAPSDTFDGRALSEQWVPYASTPTQLEVEDERLEVQVGVAGGGKFAGVSSAAPFTLHECHVIVRVGVLPPDVEGTVYLQVLQPATSRPQLAAQIVAGQHLNAGALALESGAYVLEGNQLEGGPTIAYVEAQHAWWRIRHSAGSVYLEAGPAPDAAFTVLSTLPDSDFSGPVYVAMGAGTYQSDPDAGGAVAWFDDVDPP